MRRSLPAITEGSIATQASKKDTPPGNANGGFTLDKCRWAWCPQPPNLTGGAVRVLRGCHRSDGGPPLDFGTKLICWRFRAS